MYALLKKIMATHLKNNKIEVFLAKYFYNLEHPQY